MQRLASFHIYEKQKSLVNEFTRLSKLRTGRDSNILRTEEIIS
jgi:hypothetical protein